VYKAGEYIKRKAHNDHRFIVVSEDIDNYILYNCSRMRIQTIAKVVVHGMYTPVDYSGS